MNPHTLTGTRSLVLRVCQFRHSDVTHLIGANEQVSNSPRDTPRENCFRRLPPETSRKVDDYPKTSEPLGSTLAGFAASENTVVTSN